MLYKDFYSELGKLLYAVADIDGVITQEEKHALKELVVRELAPAEPQKDEFGSNAAFYTEFEFDFLEEEIVDADAAFNSFLDFIDEHRTAFDDRMKKVCLHLSKEIANAYHKTNKKEKQLIDVLRKKIKEL